MSTPPDSRDIILAKREGYVAAKVEHFGQPLENWHLYAKRAFPLPPRQEPRTVMDVRRYWEYRVVDGKLQCRWLGVGGWNKDWGSLNLALETIDITAERVKLWADLFKTPTVEVPDDG